MNSSAAQHPSSEVSTCVKFIAPSPPPTSRRNLQVILGHLGSPLAQCGTTNATRLSVSLNLIRQKVMTQAHNVQTRSENPTTIWTYKSIATPTARSHSNLYQSQFNPLALLAFIHHHALPFASGTPLCCNCNATKNYLKVPAKCEHGFFFWIPSPWRSKWFHHFHRKELGIHRGLSVSFQEISGFSLSQRKLPATNLVYHKSHPDSLENICYDASFLLRFQHFGALQNLEPAGAMATFISTKLVDSWVELDGRWMYFDFVQHISLSFAKWPGYSSGRASLRLADSAGTSLCWAHAKRGASGSHPALASDVSDQSLDKITKVTPSAEDFWEWAFREFLRMIVGVNWSRQSSHPRISEGMRYTKSALSLSAASRSQKKHNISISSFWWQWESGGCRRQEEKSSEICNCAQIEELLLATSAICEVRHNVGRFNPKIPMVPRNMCQGSLEPSMAADTCGSGDVAGNLGSHLRKSFELRVFKTQPLRTATPINGNYIVLSNWFWFYSSNYISCY